MSDIVERLRAPTYWISGSSEGHEGDNNAPVEAAAEIERLRAALRFYANADNYKPRAEAFGDGMYAPQAILDAGYNARAALGET